MCIYGTDQTVLHVTDLLVIREEPTGRAVVLTAYVVRMELWFKLGG